MYLRESKQRRADGSVVIYLQLAENVWDAGKRRSQASIVYNCGRADDPEVIERLRRMGKSILRRCSPEEIVGAGSDWRLICAWPYGDLYVLEAIWKQLGIDAIVRQQAGTRNLGFDVERALFALVVTTKRTARAWLYKAQLREILERKQVNVVRDMLTQWATNVMRSKVDPMKEVANMIRSHLDGIVAWTPTRQTNGFLKAINGLFQSAKRKARGYGSFSTIRTVVFLLAGKLDFSKINPHAA